MTRVWFLRLRFVAVAVAYLAAYLLIRRLVPLVEDSPGFVVVAMIWITAGCTWSKLVAAPPPGAVVAGGAVVAAGAVVAVVPAGAVVSDVSSDPPLEPHAARSSEPVATMTQFRRDVMGKTVDHEAPGCIGDTHTRPAL